MTLNIKKYTKYLYICSVLALQIALPQTALAAIELYGTATVTDSSGNTFTPPPSDNFWSYKDITLGAVRGGSAIIVTDQSYLSATDTFLFRVINLGGNGIQISGEQAYLSTNKLILPDIYGNISIALGAQLYTHAGEINGTITLDRNASWISTSDVFFDGTPAPVGYLPHLGAYNNSKTVINGELTMLNTLLTISNSTLNYPNEANPSVVNLNYSGSDLKLEKAAHIVTGNSNIAHTTTNPYTTIDLKEASVWRNMGDFNIGDGAGNGNIIQARLVRSDLIIDGDLNVNTKPDNENKIELTNSLLSAQNINLNSLINVTSNTSNIKSNSINIDRAVMYIYRDSALTASNNITIGENNEGTIIISSDSILNAGSIDIAKNSGSSGLLYISDTNISNKIGTINTPVIRIGSGDGLINFAHTINSADEYGIKRSALAYQFTPNLIGDGQIVNSNGDTALTGDYTGFSGQIINITGTLFITPNATMNNNIDFITRNGVLNFDGGTQSVGNIENEAHVNFGDGLATIITANNYNAYNLNSMAMESGFANKPGLTDKLIVTGNTSGTTYLRVRDVERASAEVDDGIEIIEVLGNSNAEFILMGDYVLPDGQQAVAHGAYAYTLHKGANTARAGGDKNWYMRRVGAPSNGGNSGNGGGNGGGGGEEIYQPAVSIYEAYPQALMELGRMPSLDEREGDRTYLAGMSGGDANSIVGIPSFWTALEGRHIKIASGQTKTRTSYKQNAIKMKAGIDVPVYEDAAGRLVVGASVHYTHGKTDTRGSHHYGEGDIKTKGFGVTPTVTWYGANGFYADGQAMITMYESDMKADKINFPLANENKSTGYAFSAEVGQKFKLQGNWGATLQGQLVYSGVNFDTFKDTQGAAVIEHDHGESLRARIGGKIDYTTASDSNRTSYYGGINLYNQFLKAPQVSVYDSFGMDPVAFKGVKEKAWIGIVGGMSHSWANDKYKLYGMVGASSPFSGFGDSYTARANVGLKVSF